MLRCWMRHNLKDVCRSSSQPDPGSSVRTGRLPGVLAPAHAAKERGAGTLEYIGIAVAAAIIVAALLLVPLAPQMTAGIQNIICGVTSHIPGAGAACADQDQPFHDQEFHPRCVIARGSQSANLDGSILVVDGKTGASMAVEERSDGNYVVTIMDDEGQGLSADLVKLEVGPLLDLGAGVGIMVDQSEGHSWVFRSEDEALAFAEEARDYVNANGSFLQVGGIFHDRPGGDLPPQVTREVHSVEAFAQANAGIGPNVGGKKRNKNNDDADSSGSSGSGSGSDSDDPSGGFSADWLPQFAAGADVGSDMIMEHDRGENLDDPADDTFSFTFQVDGSAEASMNIFDASDGSERASSGTMKIEVGPDGNISGLVFGHTSLTSDTDFDGADAESVTWTTEIPVESEADRETVERWLREGGELPSPQGVREQPTQDGSPQSEFEQLIYDSGITSSETHAITSDGGGWGLNAKLAGIGGGFGQSSSSTSEQLMGAEYLQPPRSPGETRTMAEAPC